MNSWKIACLVLILMVIAIAVTPDAMEGTAEDLAESLEAAEIAFATSVLEKDFQSFGDHIDVDAVFIGGQVLDGKEAILAGWQGFFRENAPSLEWHPEEVVVRADGQLGITRGPFTLRMKAENGQDVVQSGSFSSIWQRQEDGSWRVIFDSGCPPCPVCD